MADLLSDGRTPRARLRELIGGPAPLVAPGAYDALSARLIEQAGFDAVYMTGFGTTASLIGRPDVGLLSGAEMVDNARRIVSAVDVPVIADADTGYGNAINVVRTVQLYEQAGVAGIQLEDQVMPKKCGHMSGKLLIGADEMVGKLRAAVEARRDPDLVIIARTDAVAVTGAGRRDRPGAGVRRGRRRHALRRGADVGGRHRPGGDRARAASPRWSSTGPRAAGPRRCPWSGSPSSASRWSSTRSARCWRPPPASARCWRRSRTDGTPVSALPGLPAFDEFTDLIGLPEVQRLEQRFSGA